MTFTGNITGTFWSNLGVISTFFEFLQIFKFFIFCHIGLEDGSKNPLSIIYQYPSIIRVIFDPIAEILGGGVKLTPHAERVDLNPQAE